MWHRKIGGRGAAVSTVHACMHEHNYCTMDMIVLMPCAMSSKNQLFVVIQEIEQCRWSYDGKQHEGSISPGHVVALRPCRQ